MAKKLENGKILKMVKSLKNGQKFEKWSKIVAKALRKILPLRYEYMKHCEDLHFSVLKYFQVLYHDVQFFDHGEKPKPNKHPLRFFQHPIP